MYSLGVALLRECSPKVPSYTALREAGFFGAVIKGETIGDEKGDAPHGPVTPPLSRPEENKPICYSDQLEIFAITEVTRLIYFYVTAN